MATGGPVFGRVCVSRGDFAARNAIHAENFSRVRNPYFIGLCRFAGACAKKDFR
jgi:hypothetical protein